jgi:hypothetical protein
MGLGVALHDNPLDRLGREGDAMKISDMQYASICPWCGDDFAYLFKMPKEGEPLNTNGVLLPDGTEPKQGNLMVCQHCNNQIQKLTISSIVKRW